MGRPKLLLEFGGKPLIARVVAALRDGGVESVVVIAPPESTPEGPPIAAAARDAGARVVVPDERPAQMRRSVEIGLVEVSREGRPAAVLLTPGDSPALTSGVVSRVLAAWDATPDRIVVATVGGKHAHPLILSWCVASMIHCLPHDRGVDALVEAQRGRVVEIEVAQPGLDADLNAPEDLDRWAGGPPRLAVRLFAVAKERAGRAEIEVSLTFPATVADLRRAIARQHPELAGIAPRVLIAVDSEYADDDSLIPAGSKLALIPPVSGGQGPVP
jgi:CTP:molybdopterin cytidylyltransferase MocA/molybdopterin converting factor small subunit